MEELIGTTTKIDENAKEASLLRAEIDNSKEVINAKKEKLTKQKGIKKFFRDITFQNKKVNNAIKIAQKQLDEKHNKLGVLMSDQSTNLISLINTLDSHNTEEINQIRENIDSINDRFSLLTEALQEKNRLDNFQTVLLIINFIAVIGIVIVLIVIRL